MSDGEAPEKGGLTAGQLHTQGCCHRTGDALEDQISDCRGGGNGAVNRLSVEYKEQAMRVRNYEVAADVAGRWHVRHPTWQRSPVDTWGGCTPSVCCTLTTPKQRRVLEKHNLPNWSQCGQPGRAVLGRAGLSGRTGHGRMRQGQPETCTHGALLGIWPGTSDETSAGGDFSLSLYQHEKRGRAELVVEAGTFAGSLLKRHRCVVATGVTRDLLP